MKFIIFANRLKTWSHLVHTKIYFWVERYFYSPNLVMKLLSALLLPLSLIYSLIITLKKLTTKKKSYGIKVFSVGNLVVGGSGKTPLTKALYLFISSYCKCFIILRGYKRESKGLFIISHNNEILQNVHISGDEAMEYAKMGANVIVSEDRARAIQIAKTLGAKCVILDDGFGKFDIDKFDIVLRPSIEPYFARTFPSGAYRYPLFFYRYADYIIDKDDIKITNYIKNPTKRMVLVTAIANPKRLSAYFGDVVATKFYPDHYNFKKDELKEILDKFNATSLLVTNKDYVKIESFLLPLSCIELELKLSDKFKKLIQKEINFKK